MIVAIDGPAGTGKSTIASILAKKLNITYLNSGSFYRAITMALNETDIQTEDADKVVEFAKTLKLDYKNSRLYLNGKDVEDHLHDDAVSARVAQVSSIVEIRHLVNERMQEITKSLSIICEGRDMTTVVFPNAEHKFYLDASIDVQAQRRFDQGVSNMTLEEVKAAIIKRDEIDRNKKEGALKKASDAFYIDTSALTIDQVCEIILKQIHLKGSTMEQMEVEKDESQSIMGNLLTQYEESHKLRTLEAGTLVEGKVVGITENDVFLDVGGKSEASLSVLEFGDSLPKMGDKVTVYVERVDDRGAKISKTKADGKQLIKDISQAYEDKVAVDGVITSEVKGGFEVDLGGDIRAFLPSSQSDAQKVDAPSKLIGIRGKFYIERLKSNGKTNIVVNRRKYLEEIIEEKREKFFAETQIGDTVHGTVKSFTSFGAFIDLGGFDGLLHINDMSWGHVTRPKDFVKKGQEIDLKVIRLDPAEKRINLSLKHFAEDPWVHFEEKYHVNDVVEGTVTKLTDFGAFIELEEGIEGLAHISEFSWTKKINKPSDMVKIGDKTKAVILGYDIQAGRVSLGLKQTTENPWDSIIEKYPVDAKVHGKVVKLTNTGAFIQLEDGIDGFLHAEDISWTKKVKHPGSELAVDQELDVVVMDVDPESRRIRVGLKQSSANPWVTFAQEHKAGSTLEGEVSSITDFGVFVKTAEGIEGLVNKANLSDDREVPYEEAVKKFNVGDKINVFVVDVNVEKEKAAFSVKEYKKAQDRAEISHYMSSNNDDDGAYTFGDAFKAQNNN